MKRGEILLVIAIFIIILTNVNFVSAATEICDNQRWTYITVPFGWPLRGEQLRMSCSSVCGSCSDGCSSSGLGSDTLPEGSAIIESKCNAANNVAAVIAGGGSGATRRQIVHASCSDEGGVRTLDISGMTESFSNLNIVGNQVSWRDGSGARSATVDCCVVSNTCVDKICKSDDVYCVDDCGGERLFQDCGSDITGSWDPWICLDSDTKIRQRTNTLKGCAEGATTACYSTPSVEGETQDCSSGDDCVLGSCVSCDGATCEEIEAIVGSAICGIWDDGCSGTVDCGPCSVEICPSGLIGLWKFEDDLEDSSSRNNDGTFFGGTSNFVDGKIGRSLDLDGVNDYVSIADFSDFTGLAAFSLESWARFDEGSDFTPNAHLIMQLTNSGASTRNVFYLARATDNKVMFSTVNDAGTFTDNFGDDVLNNNRWYHIVVTWDSTTKKIYVNGALDKSFPWEESLIETDGPLNIGADKDIGELNDFMDGDLDEVAIYNRALTLEEIEGHYNSGMGLDLSCSTCSNGIKDGDETGVDCGGVCPPCFVEPTYCADDDQIIMKLFQPSNSHGALWTEDYDYKICCDKIFGDADECKEADPHNGNPILWLTLENNSHISKNFTSAYPTPVKYGNLVCTLEEKRCTNDRKMVASLYENNNTHLTDPHYTPSGMVSWWRFDEAYGTVVGDSKRDNHGTTHGATWNTGIAGSGLIFDGDDYVEIPADSSLNLEKFTTEAWFEADRFPADLGYFFILAKGEDTSTGNSNYGIFLINAALYGGTTIGCDFEVADDVDIVDSNNEDNNYRLIYNIDASYLRRPVHVACTLDGDNYKMYLDGVEVSADLYRTNIYDGMIPLASLGGQIPVTTPSQFYIGATYQSSADDTGIDDFDYFFEGMIDEVAIYNRALSAEEVQHRYNMGDYELKLCCKSGTYVPAEERYWANMRGVRIGNDVEPVVKAQKGDTVKMILKNTGLAEGTTVEFEIYEHDSGPFNADDPIRTGDDAIEGVVNADGDVISIWTITQDDINAAKGITRLGDLEEFIFKVEGSKSNELEVEDSTDNSLPFAEIIYPAKLADITDVSNRRFKIWQNITFQARVYDEDDDLDVIWEFGDDNITTILGVLSTICASESACEIHTNHSYENWGTKDVVLTAEEKTRDQEAVDDTDVFIYDLGLNVFSRITSPTRDQIFAPSSVGKVDFDGSKSYVANCTHGSCTAGSTCYLVGDVDPLYCYDFTKSRPLVGYDLWFNWTYSSGSEIFGSWNDDYDRFVKFKRPFYHPDRHWAKLKVGYEPR